MECVIKGKLRPRSHCLPEAAHCLPTVLRSEQDELPSPLGPDCSVRWEILLTESSFPHADVKAESLSKVRKQERGVKCHLCP